MSGEGPASVRSTERGDRDRDVPPPPADGEVLDVPEFIPPR